MLMTESNSNSTTHTGLPSDQYKRAVLRHPPSRFTVEFLTPSKSNGSYNHGLHIAPLMIGDIASISSRGSSVEYDIWRRWEDCLWLQEALEQEYSRAAREKKVRLQQGKGVKAFNGMYKQDMASSWESLPPGPDPNSVAQDVHGHLPRLTKRGTFFRASQATIEQRQREFQCLIETLFSDDMPSLIQEIRASTVVTDFFGFWRRDYEQLDRSRKVARSVMTSSLFSSYFSDSTPSLSGRSSFSSEVSPKSLPNSPAKKSSSNRSSSESRSRLSSGSARSSSPSTRSTLASTDLSEVSRYPASSKYTSSSSGGSGASESSASTYRPRRRPLSTASSDSSSTTHSDLSSDGGSMGSTNPSIVDDAPYVFGHNPQHSNERSSSVLEVLPEEREMLSKSSEVLTASVMRRPSASTMGRKMNRSCQIVGSPAEAKQEKPSHKRPIRESWQTTSSLGSNATEIIEGLGFTLPNPVKENKFRASMASISTFMTTDSAEAVIPETPTTAHPNDRWSTPSKPRISTTVSLSDFEIYSDYDGDSNSVLDDFPRPISDIPECPYDRPETPTGHEYSDAPRSPNSIETSFSTPCSTLKTAPSSPNSLRTSFNRPPSPTSTIGTSHTTSTSTSTSSVLPGTLSLKAAHNDTIILLRVPREISFTELRQRLYNKFVGQEGVPLSQDFTVAFVQGTQPSTQPLLPRDRLRSASLSSADRLELIFMNSDADWGQIISSAIGSKLTLRILDPN